MSPQRLQEIHAGASLHPAEVESVRPTRANAWIRQGVSPEKHAQRAVTRQIITWALAVALVFVCACLLVLLFAFSVI
ncbi:hypothetical protein [Mycolicibacterium cosmeticum]|uniref:hypothetical protein n=1 Tax=Mycolicibacterium cosmeticum TaxID=258533 RepID=UPI003204ABB7